MGRRNKRRIERDNERALGVRARQKKFRRRWLEYELAECDAELHAYAEAVSRSVHIANLWMRLLHEHMEAYPHPLHPDVTIREWAFNFIRVKAYESLSYMTAKTQRLLPPSTER